MGKNIPDTFIDLQLDQVEGDLISVCSAEPTTFTEATVTFELAAQAITGGDYAKANGDVSGRKNTLTTPSGTTIDTTGTATHVAVTLAAGSQLRLVTTTDSTALTASGTVDIGAFDHEIGDPT